MFLCLFAVQNRTGLMVSHQNPLTDPEHRPANIWLPDAPTSELSFTDYQSPITAYLSLRPTNIRLPDFPTYTFHRLPVTDHRLLSPHHPPPQHLHRIIKPVGNPFLERNNSIVCNGDILRTNFGAAFGDIAITDAVGFF